MHCKCKIIEWQHATPLTKTLLQVFVILFPIAHHKVFYHVDIYVKSLIVCPIVIYLLPVPHIIACPICMFVYVV